MASSDGFILHTGSGYRNALRRKPARSTLASNQNEDDISLTEYRSDIPITGNEYEPREHVSPVDGFHSFSNRLPEAGPYGADNTYSGAPSSIELQKGAHDVHDEPLNEDFVQVRSKQNTFRTFIWPALALCLPMVLLAAALLYIVFNYLVHSDPNMFDPNDSGQEWTSDSYLLVRYSSTKLVFLASFLSTMAPLLAGCIMSLTAVLVYRRLKTSSDVSDFPHLPTPYQTSLLIGLLAASYEQLFSSFVYLASSRRTAKASPVLVYAMVIFLMSVFLSLAVAATDAYLHIATVTISINLYKNSTSVISDLGRGINSYCLGLDRLVDNNGFPCTMPATAETSISLDWARGQPEIHLLAHNSSANSSIHVTQSSEVPSGRLAILMPKTFPEQSNFEATTIGVSAQCSLIPPTQCNTSQWGPENYYTNFNCSTEFWGVLGLPPAQSTLGDSAKALSPNLAFLAINQNSNLIYNYFTNHNLDAVYNPADLNASATQEVTSQPWPDSQLVNPAYIAFAWRTGIQSFSGSFENGMVLSESVQAYDYAAYIDYFLSCAVSSYDVTYSWVNGTLNDLYIVKHTNGSIMDMWTGMADYAPSIRATDENWQDYNIQSVTAGNSTTSYETRFGELVAQDALAAIGAYSSGRQVLRQQDQTTELVAKVPKAALGALLACSLLYPVLGIVLLAKAWRASRQTGPASPLFSYWGLTAAAFIDNTANKSPQSVPGLMDERPRDREEALRLFIRSDQGQDRFALWRRSQAGHITEMQRSQTKVDYGLDGPVRY